MFIDVGICLHRYLGGLLRWLSGKKNLPANARDLDSIPGLGRLPIEGNVNPLQFLA